MTLIVIDRPDWVAGSIASLPSEESGAADAADASGVPANNSWNRVAASLCAKASSKAPKRPLRWCVGRYFSQNTYGWMSRSQIRRLVLRRSHEDDTFGGTRVAAHGQPKAEEGIGRREGIRDG